MWCSCTFVWSSILLLKVKPDGPVYEVQFTSQLMMAVPGDADCVGRSPRYVPPPSPDTGILSGSSLTSVSCSVDSSKPPVNSGHDSVAVAVSSEHNHVVRSSTNCSQQTQPRSNTCRSSQSIADRAVEVPDAKSSSGARYVSGNLSASKKPDNVTSGNAVHSDIADCR